jgi:hypothetical protein
LSLTIAGPPESFRKIKEARMLPLNNNQMKEKLSKNKRYLVLGT